MCALPITSELLKKVVSGIEKSHVKCFAIDKQCLGYNIFSQGNKSSLIDVYNRFPPRSC